MSDYTKQQTFWGTFFLISSALCTAGSNVYYSNMVQNISPFTFTFISFLLTAILFHALQWYSPIRRHSGSFINWKTLIGINISTAGAFMSFYFALKYIEPAVAGAIEIGAAPVSSLLLMKVLQRQQVKWIDLSTGTGALIGSLFLIMAALQGKSGFGSVPMPFTAAGLLASIMCGFFAALAAIYSKKLSDARWSSTQILAHRFYVIIILSLMLSLQQASLFEQVLTHWRGLLTVTFTGVILPLYFLQLGIKRSATFFVMMSLSFIPVFTFAFQFLDPRITVSLHSLAGIIIILAFASLSVYTNHRRTAAISNTQQKAV
ncbi:DMT family transporter [Halobacillus sp. A5]|uniref:DMT family transporter n=1 Tax=Halobacillus sp. A5 TaxID=2880263 RepID=UPI0020A69F35|nr:DMT family transporter [Halobacillus sp. A5]MCP3028505.1 DMT family transporter [Halobacillus sp. A5]